MTVHVEIDITGTGLWHRFKSLDVAVGKELEYQFPEAFQAYWVRLVPSVDCVMTGRFEYR